MGRSGISKEQVKEAKDRLLSRGQPATVDAIRTELGNTGSKGTIHRHLKQIREYEENRAQDGFIKTIASDLVNRLTLQIQRETQEAITQAELGYRAELESMEQQLEERASCLDAAKKRIAELERMIAELEKQTAGVMDKPNCLNPSVKRISDEIMEESPSAETDEKHYSNTGPFCGGDSHQQQVQKLQAELENLGMQLARKEASIVKLNQLNDTHAEQIEDLRRQLENFESSSRELNARMERDGQGDPFSTLHSQSLREKNELLEAKLEEVNKQLKESAATRRSLEAQLAVIRAELAAKDKLLSKFLRGESLWIP